VPQLLPSPDDDLSAIVSATTTEFLPRAFASYNAATVWARIRSTATFRFHVNMLTVHMLEMIYITKNNRNARSIAFQSLKQQGRVNCSVKALDLRNFTCLLEIPKFIQPYCYLKFLLSKQPSVYLPAKCREGIDVAAFP
jgi:hypothetical protein